MAFDPDLATRVRRLLIRHLPDGVAVSDITEKKMFGGLAFMVRGKLCVGISGRDCEVMLRIGKANHDAALTHEGVRTTVMKGREYRGYVDVDETGLPVLEELVAQALRHNQELSAAPPRRRKQKP
ncbi:TfoX/Sxy family protein [Vandammella animalimorsus]|uniref:TfoX/Sxy family protein n=1 Tax=Vandammella animalimorsus TaxID=2029117 RepID=UPI0011782FFE|nr:TfoX/Sxy family protein [Vandammella animalimorsus]